MLDVLASPVGHLLAFIHSALSTFLIPSSGPAWALSIVLLNWGLVVLERDGYQDAADGDVESLGHDAIQQQLMRGER